MIHDATQALHTVLCLKLHKCCTLRHPWVFGTITAATTGDDASDALMLLFFISPFFVVHPVCIPVLIGRFVGAFSG